VGIPVPDFIPWYGKCRARVNVLNYFSKAIYVMLDSLHWMHPEEQAQSRILHLDRFFAREIAFGIFLERHSTAGSTEVVDLPGVSRSTTAWITGIDAHAAHRVDRLFGFSAV
jgi:hypothetical protein